MRSYTWDSFRLGLVVQRRMALETYSLGYVRQVGLERQLVIESECMENR